MTRKEEIDIHSERAMEELDCALEAHCLQAARAHFGLSALHLDRMRDIQNAAEPKLRLVPDA